MKKSRGTLSFVIPEIFNRESKSFQILWTPDRGIQGQAKNGLKIAGVTAKSWSPKKRDYQSWDVFSQHYWFL